MHGTVMGAIFETKRKTYRTADVASTNAANLEAILAGDRDHGSGVEAWTMGAEMWMARKKTSDEGASSLWGFEWSEDACGEVPKKDGFKLNGWRSWLC